MRVLFHPDFPKDIRKFETDYKAISEGLGTRFRKEVLDAVDAVKTAPQGAGHFLPWRDAGRFLDILLDFLATTTPKHVPEERWRELLANAPPDDQAE